MTNSNQRHGTYVGPVKELQGDTALVRSDGYAQFDIQGLTHDGKDLSHGWHQFPLEHFQFATPLKLGNFYGQVTLVDWGDHTYLALGNYDSFQAIELTLEETALAKLLFSSIGDRKTTDIGVDDDG